MRRVHIATLFCGTVLLMLGCRTGGLEPRGADDDGQRAGGGAMRIDLGDGVGIDLVAVPAGTFTMGGSQAPEEVARLFGNQPAVYLDEQPAHEVQLSAFQMGRTEITVDQFARFAKETDYVTTAESEGSAYFFDGMRWAKTEGRNWRSPGYPQAGDHPVAYVTWPDAAAFCEWASKTSGRRVTLPSEAQWEYAARAGSTAAFPWGDDPEGGIAMEGNKALANSADRALLAAYPGRKAFGWDDGYAFTAPVGNFKPNAFGLCDMIGNVWEWTADWHAEDYYAKSPRLDPTGPASGEHRVLRGGCWLNEQGGSRVADRNAWPLPTDAYGGYGFRVVVNRR